MPGPWDVFQPRENDSWVHGETNNAMVAWAISGAISAGSRSLYARSLGYGSNPFSQRATRAVDRFARIVSKRGMFGAGRRMFSTVPRGPGSQMRFGFMADPGTAALGGVATFARGMTAALGAATLLPLIPSLADYATNAALDYRPRDYRGPSHEFGTTFFDPRGAYTQRQRALSAIHDSQLTTRAALGNEASFMHR